MHPGLREVSGWRTYHSTSTRRADGNPSKRHQGELSSAPETPQAAARAALVDLPASGCELPVPALPAGRAWTPDDTARWDELWQSPQAVMWDYTARGTVAVLLVYEAAILAGTAAAWQAQEARYAAEALGLTPKAMAALDGGSPMASDRRAARQLAPPPTAGGIPTDLAAGPCIELWADPGHHFPEWSALSNWHTARDAWATARGLNPATDYRHLPDGLRDRAPYFRNFHREGAS